MTFIHIMVDITSERMSLGEFAEFWFSDSVPWVIVVSVRPATH